MGPPTVLLPIAHGTEEIEAVTISDVLVRAGAKVTITSCEDTKIINMSRGVKMVADELITDSVNKSYDMIVIPGGAVGATTCGKCANLINLLKKQKNEQKFIAALCAAPALVLQQNNLLDGPAVAYPSFMSKIENKGEGRIVVSDKCVTSIGPGSAMEFAVALIEFLFDKNVKKEVAEALCMHPMIPIN